MTLRYFENNVPDLIEEYYQLSFSENIIPFQSAILPLGFTHITHVFYGEQKAVLNKKEMPLKDTILSGQFFRSYQFHCLSESMSFGISFHPTALFKILNTNISKLDNTHLSLLEFHPTFYHKIKSIFDEFTTPDQFVKELNKFFSNLKLTTNKYTEIVDLVINLIIKNDGLINIQDILNHINISQKTLETQFKIIVGLTPGKYIRLYRFIKLMRKYESQEIAIKDLMYMFDYYDRSHFSKDFKLFMNETPKSYFKKDYPLIKAVFKN
ncbi:helix-turn-helix domain-containing protein [Psychroserpens algicola]|uniref:Helix-turn-helix domain-containing protein n=1 Tax=Psychroserpens algicola TaxID=1719034 RepID=A0ABT0H532_9FLAO|nr:helix-turn-helix domain-containing protein [Psychroserpens algicola]MCK8479475.1 helix-turn-helix domain-containing protein [Psychroserpens algicola]